MPSITKVMLKELEIEIPAIEKQQIRALIIDELT
jgi:hypothetical protein